ncbi:unnamed protein product, partial [Auanema sp. JU1783]
RTPEPVGQRTRSQNPQLLETTLDDLLRRTKNQKKGRQTEVEGADINEFFTPGAPNPPTPSVQTNPANQQEKTTVTPNAAASETRKTPQVTDEERMDNSDPDDDPHDPIYIP